MWTLCICRQTDRRRSRSLSSTRKHGGTPGAGSLLYLAESRGVAPEFGCRGDSCGTCRTRIVEGCGVPGRAGVQGGDWRGT
ncbi:2Fe-2S iron-sulfur cluster-binding protein [Paraburkholderia sp. BL6669N2]|uniref:2Fe-2S iron-sulfur cluster-binding protein n=1 Tax=Paraburkholderia sp. BL6669N2 TaxID=1938807 RepID=UPI0021637341|nr:2Fe-2S iron-sulfur cluster-binding protein [Paraburkholderia sp. BL6669N2]